MGNSNASKSRMVRETSMGEMPSQIVSGHLFVGNRLDAMSAKMANPMKFTHVLCLEASAKYPDPDSKLEFMCAPLADDGSDDLEIFFKDVEGFILDGAKNGRILIHCTSGVNRSPAIAILYLMKYWKKDFDSAYELVKRQRPAVNIHPHYVEQLEDISVQLEKNRDRRSLKRISGDSPASSSP
mmetsp:Transcript_9388/g.18575  ORF Transcript_9388/g.18575 Transcript_9388/m.18575 type:complete len:183 (+) Transcript_9388:162-710(+)|eukprot:CAMPEP_0171496914 /NCGR_PEP_ID=MMETSP0958-20121227/6969_1 /TAXON_ID=87120 /ORGANISM="Aurantiochytrium limacinum, Strain ATCCMYA-1381" /LENGTH=182 /DNA_ID=CAMNT_0012031075 /DNA_START=532 /DNA_END=1080 /DNA_ORIENTATION=+